MENDDLDEADLEADELADPEHEAYLAEVSAQFDRNMAAIAKQQQRNPFLAERQLILWQFVDTRHRRRLTQVELARQLNVHQSVISRFERGRGNPSLNQLLAIAKALEVRLVLE